MWCASRMGQPATTYGGGDLGATLVLRACRHAPRGSIPGYAQLQPLPGWRKCPPLGIVFADGGSCRRCAAHAALGIGPIGCDRRRWWSCCDRRRAVAGRKQRLGARGNRLTDYGGAAGVVGNYLVLGHRLRRWREFLGKALIIRMTRGDVFSIPGRGWQPCVAPYFADRGCRRHAGTSDGHPRTPHPGGGARLSLPLWRWLPSSAGVAKKKEAAGQPPGERVMGRLLCDALECGF